MTGEAGLSHEWTAYRAGDWIVCPGYGTGDRRNESRGEDRRREARPCTYTFGRVQLGCRAYVRILNRGEQVTRPCTTLGCPSCRATVMMVQVSPEAA